jgi:predicted nucleotidyltransferase
MESFAEKIKRLRKEKCVPLRVVSSSLKIDPAILSKLENGKRIATREMVSKLAGYYKVNENDLVVAWLSDKLLYETENESLALEALKVAEEKIEYKKSPPLSKEKIIEIIREFLKKDGRVSKAWIFGSLARGDNNIRSDIDLMVRFKDPLKMSLFDYADISYLLEQQLDIKIDLVEEGYLLPFALKTAKNDLRLIYE